MLSKKVKQTIYIAVLWNPKITAEPKGEFAYADYCLNNFPQRGVAGHVAPNFLAYDKTYLQKLGTFNLVHSFVLWKAERAW